jgi:hypothetical protein
VEALDIFGATGFQLAFVVSASGMALLALVGRGRTDLALPGVVVATATVAGVLTGLSSGRKAFALVAAVFVLLTAGVLVRRFSARFAVSATAHGPGAVVLGVAVGNRSTDWLGPFVVGSVVLLGASCTTARRPRDLDAVSTALFAIAAAGIYVCVPETSNASPLVGAALPALIWSWPLLQGRLGPGVGACVGCAVWTAADGGASRPGAVVGGVACIGVLWLAPLAAEMAPALVRRGWSTDRVRWSLLLLQLLLVATCARVAGLLTSFWQSAVVCVVASALVFGLLLRSLPASDRSARE